MPLLGSARRRSMPHEALGNLARPGDVRMAGFTDRVSVERAAGWIDAHAPCLPDELVEIADASGRVLAAAVAAPADVPPSDRAAQNGYAVRSNDTVGAGDYNPLFLALQHTGDSVPAGSAALVLSGATLPSGADAVVPFELAQENGARLEVFAALAQGSGVEPRGQQASAGAEMIAGGRCLRMQDIGLLAALGLDRVRVIRRPRVALIIAGAKSSDSGVAPDADGPMLRQLVRRDGGIVCRVVAPAATRAAMVEAMAASSADAILVAGRTGTGPDDEAPLALAEAGQCDIHGIAMRPGGSAGLGRVGGVPVVLLPGDPLACLGVYTMLAARLIRRLGGRDPEPVPFRAAEVGRKIVSAVGSVDLCQVRFVGERAEPVGSPDSAGLAAAVRADGYVIVPAHLEGYAPGARVAVHAFGERGQ